MYTAEDLLTDGPCTVMYTGGVDGWCRRAVCTGRVYGTAVYGPFSRANTCSRAVYTAAVYRAHDTLHYTAVDGPYMDV